MKNPARKSGPVLTGHPVLRGQFPKSRIESLVIPINKSFIKWTSLLIKRGETVLDRCDIQ